MPQTRSARGPRASKNVDTPSSTGSQNTPKQTKDTKATETTESIKLDRTKKPRHRMTNRQLEHLEALFQQETHPSRRDKEALADRVGMDMRTVTVWFQNRRQLAKKVTDENQLPNSASIQRFVDECRSPLADVEPNRSSRQPGPLEPKQPGSKAGAPHTLPPEPTEVACSFGVKPGAATAAKHDQNKRTLEWACSQSEKRSRLQVDTGGRHTKKSPTDGATVGKQVKAAFTPGTLKRMSLEDVPIPPEYSAIFAPDVVLGASLLLTFKYSK